jgi:hypothetical protein
MSFYRFCEWLSQTNFSIALREQPYDYSVLLIIHVLSLAVFGGVVVMGNLRVLGLAMRSVPVSEVIGQFRPWKWTGFVVIFITGMLLTISDPVEYRDNIMYWISTALLIAVGVNAFIFSRGVYQSVATWDTAAIAPESARRWAQVSLFLWIALVFAGRGIAFF